MKSFFKSYFWIPSLIAFLLYFQTLQFGSAWGDDHVVIDPIARDFNLMFRGFYQSIPGSHFFPSSFFQCFIVNLIFGIKGYPFSFHLYQLMLHMVSCVLAVLVLFRITSNKLISVLIVTLWTVHPLNVESLTRLVCAPAHVPAGTFCLAFLLCFLEMMERKSFKSKVILLLLGVLFFLISITSYEQYILFPFVLGLIALLKKDKKTFQGKDSMYFLIIPIILVYVVYVIWRYLACSGSFFYAGDEFITWADIGSIKDILFRVFWLAPQLLVHYFRLFFYPDYLAESKADWYMVGSSVWSAYSLFCQMIVVSLIVIAVTLRKKIPLFLTGLFWFLITMLPVLQVIPLFTIVDEHYCYIPILGIFLSVFSLVNYFWKNLTPRILLISILPIFCVLTWRTLFYIPSAKDQLTQYVYLVKEAPKWSKAYYVASAFYYAAIQNRVNELPKWLNEKTFEEEMERWIKNNLKFKLDLSHKFGPIQMPYNYYFYRSMFMYLYDANRIKEASMLMDQAIAVKRNWFGWGHIATFLVYSGNWEASWQYLKNGITLNPKTKILHDPLFIQIAKNAKKFNEAEQIIKTYIKLNAKSSYPYLFAGIFYRVFDKTDLALQSFKDAVSKDKVVSVNDKDLYYVAIDLFLKNKMSNRAKQTLETILSFDPFDVKAKEMLFQLSQA